MTKALRIPSRASAVPREDLGAVASSREDGCASRSCQAVSAQTARRPGVKAEASTPRGSWGLREEGVPCSPGEQPAQGSVGSEGPEGWPGEVSNWGPPGARPC